MHNTRERGERRLLLGHELEDLGLEQRIIALRLLCRADIRQPSAFHLCPQNLFYAIGGKIVDRLVKPELRLTHLHHLNGKIRVHGRCRDIGQKAPEMPREVRQ